jgi:hypothetical protein
MRTTTATVLLLLLPSAWGFSPLSSLTSTTAKGSRLVPLRLASDNNDDKDAGVPFFLRDEPTVPEPGPTFFDTAANDIASTVEEVAAKAGELGSTVAETVKKIDWDEIKSNVVAFAESEEVRNLKESSVRRSCCSN